MSKRKLMIVATVADTLFLLKEQIAFLSPHFDIYICSGRGSRQPILLDLKSNQIPINFINFKRNLFSPFDVIALIELSYLLLKIRPHIIHTYTPKAGLLGMFLGSIYQIPIRVHTFTGLLFPSSSQPFRTFLLFFDRLISYFSTSLIAESAGVYSQLREHIIPRNLTLLGKGSICGVNLSYFDDPAASSNKTTAISVKEPHQRRFSFIYIGRLTPDKGIVELVHAFDKLSAESPLPHLTILGSVDERSPINLQLISYIASSPRISWHTHKADIRPFLSRADALVLPSYREGFPNVILEAFAMSKPVISTRVPGAVDIVIPGMNGWLVAPRDILSLYQALKDCLELEQQLLHQYGIYGRNLIVTHYRSEYVAKNLLNFYKKLLNPKN